MIHSTWLPLDMDGVPAELRTLGWIGVKATWDAEKKDWRKEPRQIGYPSRLAANNRPDDWRGEGDIREVQALCPELFDGYGVALVASAGLTFIDLDDVRDTDTGEIAPWALRVVERFDSLTEISMSGEGLHIFCFGTLPTTGRNNYLDGDLTRKVEMYDRGRFAYVTGQSYGSVRPLAHRQALVTLLAEHILPPGAIPGIASASTSTSGRDQSPIPIGQRNDQVFRIARGFVLKGLVGAALERALLAVNAARCTPPLPESEVVRLARHAERLPDRRSA